MMTDPSGRPRPWRAPPPLGPTLAGADLADLAAEHARLSAIARDLRREQLELERAGPRARRADTEASALALRAGSKDPGPLNEAAHRQASEDVSRRLEAAQRATQMASRDMAARTAERRSTWLEDVEARLPAAQETATADLAALRASWAALQSLRTVAAWLANGRARTTQPEVIGLMRTPRGAAYPLGRVLDALAATLAVTLAAGQESAQEADDDEER